jgi:transcriptional regulator with XRE-family HTH domain
MSQTDSEKATCSDFTSIGSLKSAAIQAATPVVLAVADSDAELRDEIIELFKQLSSGDLDCHERQATTALLAEILFPGRNRKTPARYESQTRASVNRPNASSVVERMKKEEATFSIRLRETMERRGVTQTELAEKLGIGQPAISMMLQRRCRPQRRTIERLAEALGVAVTELWPGERLKVDNELDMVSEGLRNRGGKVKRNVSLKWEEGDLNVYYAVGIYGPGEEEYGDRFLIQRSEDGSYALLDHGKIVSTGTLEECQRKADHIFFEDSRP